MSHYILLWQLRDAPRERVHARREGNVDEVIIGQPPQPRRALEKPRGGVCERESGGTDAQPDAAAAAAACSNHDNSEYGGDLRTHAAR